MDKLSVALCLTSLVLLGSAGQSVALPSCPSSGIFHNCFGTWTNDDGSKYVGEWRNDKQHGQGTYTYGRSSQWAGDKYVGEYRDGKMHGHGTYTFASGDKYVGEHRNDKQHGQGTYTYGRSSQWAGDKYVGEYRDGKMHGHGTYTFADGEKYVGDIKDGKRHGQGTYTFTDGSIEEGVWENDSFIRAEKVPASQEIDASGGGGSAALPECDVAEEVWNNCFAAWTFDSGDNYVGEWLDNNAHGQGIYNYASGDQYVGEWRNNKQHGQGILTFGPSSQWAGDQYVGEWTDDKKHGQGTYTFADGSVLEGIWENDNFLYAQKVIPDVPEETQKKATVMSGSDELVTASSGSGFAVSASGHILTNYHVIEGCDSVQIHHQGDTIKAKIIAHDSYNDLALLKGDFKPSTVLALSRDNPELLQDIYVAGYPFGQAISASIKVTKGIVSSLTGLEDNVSNLQIDAALQPGNSGGPILDEKGNVVGVAVAKLDLMAVVESWGVVPENTNFGVKSMIAANLLQSNNVELKAPNTEAISKSILGKWMSDGTYYLSCWMTMAQIEQMRAQKVMFKSFD